MQTCPFGKKKKKKKKKKQLSYRGFTIRKSLKNPSGSWTPLHTQKEASWNVSWRISTHLLPPQKKRENNEKQRQNPSTSSTLDSSTVAMAAFQKMMTTGSERHPEAVKEKNLSEISRWGGFDGMAGGCVGRRWDSGTWKTHWMTGRYQTGRTFCSLR